jgi:hypothetical protein
VRALAAQITTDDAREVVVEMRAVWEGMADYCPPEEAQFGATVGLPVERRRE